MNDNMYCHLPLVKKITHTFGIEAEIFAADIQDSGIHMHDGIEIYYVLTGSVDVKISFNSYSLAAGDFLVVNSYEVHRITRTSQSSAILVLQISDCLLDHHLFVFDPFFYNNFNREKVKEMKIHMVKLYQLSIKHAGDHEVPHQYEKLLAEIISLCKIYFKMENYTPYQKSLSPFIHHSVNLTRIKNAYHYIYNNCFTRLRLSDMADIAHIDLHYASRLLKEGLGRTFQESINIIRVDRAEVYLLSTDMPISQIVSLLDFSSQHYFTKCFTCFFGMTPASYRKKFAKETYPHRQMQQEILASKSVLLPAAALPQVCQEKFLTDEQRLLRTLQEVQFMVCSLHGDHFTLSDGTQIIRQENQITAIFPTDSSLTKD